MRHLLPILLLTACNGPDFNASGVDVFTNGYDIDSAMIDFVVKDTQIRLKDVLGIDKDLPKFLYKLNVSVEYVEPNDRVLKLDGEYVRGMCYDTSTFVHYLKDEEKSVQCMEHYYIFSHELLHILSTYLLKASDEDNHSHNVEGVFFEWAYNNGMTLNGTTIEFWTYMDIKDKCGFEYQ